jgi:hypothetical protein
MGRAAAANSGEAAAKIWPVKTNIAAKIAAQETFFHWTLDVLFML